MAELIQREDSLNTGREKLNEAIKASDRAESNSDYAVGTAETALSNSESTQTQLDTIVIDGDSSVEAAQARVDADGNTYSTLKDRLDEKETEFSSQLVEAMKQSFSDKNRALLFYKLNALNKENGKVVMIGDSLTRRNWYANFENIFTNIEFINEGVGGNTTVDVINRVANIENGDLYILAIGVNDVRYHDDNSAKTPQEYISNIQTIISGVDNDFLKWVCIAPWPAFDGDTSSNLPYYQRDNLTDEFGDFLADFCGENNMIYINGTKTIREFIDWGNKGVLLSDSIHPKEPEGMKFYADIILYGNVNGASYCLKKTKAIGNNLYRIELLNSSIENSVANNVLLKKIIADQEILEIWTDNYRQGLSNPETLLQPFTTSNDQRFSNNVDEFPFNITFSTNNPIKELWQLQEYGNNFKKTIGEYRIYKSRDKEAIVDLQHKSWKRVYENADTNVGIANLLYSEPSHEMNKLNYYAIRIVPTDDDVSLKKIKVSQPIILANVINTAGSSQNDWSHLLVENKVNYIISKNSHFNLLFATNRKLSDVTIESISSGANFRVAVYHSEILNDLNVFITDDKWTSIFDESSFEQGKIEVINISKH